MLDNLLATLDAAPPGTEVTLRLTPGPTRDWTERHVLDQGPGVGEDERTRAFDRFWRGSTTNWTDDGLGD